MHICTCTREYSLLDGACRIGPLIERIKALGMDACAVTDHGVMYGVVDFYRAAKAAGIHPVIGCEVYVCPNMDDKTSLTRDYSHLILLCENQTGYKNLSRLVSEGFLRGYYYRPRVDYALLEKYHEGLIALSACLSGDLPKLLLDGRDGDARQMAKRYLDIFGRDNFFIELQDHGIPEQKRVLPRLVKLARGDGHSHRGHQRLPLPRARRRRRPGGAHVHPDGQDALGRQPHAHDHRPALRQVRAGDARRVSELRREHRAHGGDREALPRGL